MVKKRKDAEQERVSRGAEYKNTPDGETPKVDFPIIAIGASAGGLEALELFLGNVPEGAGMAFVIVQHLDPTRKGYLVDLLKRKTAMAVSEVEDNTFVQPDCVYIIPPDKDMSLFHGVLHLFEPAAPRGLRLPVDFLFRSLADDQQERAIGVILSGMGTDGTLGLRAIKERGGAVLAQEPTQAKFDGMPKSAVDTGLVDIVAPVEELPSRIAAYVKHGPLKKLEPDLADHDRKALENIIVLLRSEIGHDFSLYKKPTLYRRIERRLGIHQIDDLVTYVRFLQDNPQELQVLFKELLIGVTRFFRDPEAWEELKEQAISAIVGDPPVNQPIRTWIAGCSTGEEAYSLAIMFKEAQEDFETITDLSLQIFATDLDSDAIDRARQGSYPANIAADVSPERLSRFFTEEEHGYRVRQDIRDMVVFATHNVIADPPFSNIDILSCRNLLIYLTPTLQKKLLALFHHSLNPGGFLFLGRAESIGDSTELFDQLKANSRLYRSLQTTAHKELLEFPSVGFRSPPRALKAAKTQPKAKEHTNLEDLANQLILQRYSPAAVLVNGRGDILYTRGRTGKYLEVPAGKANWNVFAMTHEGMRFNLSRGFEQAVSEGKTVSLNNMRIDTDSGERTVDVSIQPLASPEPLRDLVMIVFKDVRTLPQANETCKTRLPPARVAELESELEESRQELKNLRTEMQSYEEELLTAYEELQSTNEELQSTNEEITTSREELQSLNEELTTVNYELQQKIDGLSRANNDLKNFLENTDIATLFLDSGLCVRRYTAQTAKIINLIPGDVGRPITDIVSDLIYPELADDAREVLRTLELSEKVVPTNDGQHFKVRIMPYHTLENKIDGLVITYTDVTTSKILENTLRKTQASLEESIDLKDRELDEAKKELESEDQQERREKGSDEAPGTEKPPETPS